MSDNISDEQVEGYITEKDLVTVMDEAMAAYAPEVILHRAIPDARDGLKPVQRRLLWQTHLSKLGPDAKHMKLAKLSGMVLAYHPHSSGSIDGTAVMLSQAWTRRTPLIDIHGNNGSIDGLTAAASRYIEARQAPAAKYLTTGLDHDAVDLVDNFDSTCKEPKVMPAAYPVAMTNGTQGMAIGFASSILPHNPLELLDGAKALVNDPDMSPQDLAKIVKGPDFPTGGVLVDSEETAIAEAAGESVTYTLRASMRIKRDEDGLYLEIYEAPYDITLDKLMENMVPALEKLRSLGVIDFRNDTDGDDVSIKVFFRKNTSQEDMEKAEAYLYRRTKLESKYSANNMMIVDGHPRCIGVKDYLLHFIKFRKETLRRVWSFDEKKHEDDLELVLALIFAIENGVEIVKMAQSSKSRSDFEQSLVEKYSQLSQRQAEYIAGIPIYRFSKHGEELPKLYERRKNHENDISDLDKLLTDEAAATQALLEDIEQTKAGLSEYVRRTKFVKSEDVADLVKQIDATEEVIEDKPMEVVITKPLSMRKLGVKAFENQSSAGKSAQEIVWHKTVSTKDFVAGITRDGKTVVRRVNDLEQANLDVRMQPLNRDVRGLVSDDEFIGGVELVDDPNVKLVTVSDRGYVKVMNPIVLKPNNTRTRAYSRRTWTASGLKGGTDKLWFAQTFTIEEMNSLKLQIVVRTDRGREKVRTLVLSDILSRSDSPNSSGARWVNTHDGEWRIVRIDVVGKDEPETDDFEIEGLEIDLGEELSKYAKLDSAVQNEEQSDEVVDTED